MFMKIINKIFILSSVFIIAFSSFVFANSFNYDKRDIGVLGSELNTNKELLNSYKEYVQEVGLENSLKSRNIGIKINEVEEILNNVERGAK